MKSESGWTNHIKSAWNGVTGTAKGLFNRVKTSLDERGRKHVFQYNMKHVYANPNDRECLCLLFVGREHEI